MNSAKPKDIAREFMLLGVQHWGQSKEDRAAATKAYLGLAGFSEGPEADQWLKSVLAGLRRGEFNDEVAQLEAAAIAKAEA